jgi:transcriptional regulator with XRE-family HTH domain
MDRPRDILAANMKALMSAKNDLRLLPQITAKSGISNGTLDRTRRAASALNIDDLGRLARAFGLEAWQLLVPALDANAPPQLADADQLRDRAVLQLLRAAEEVAKYRVR